MDVTYLHGLVRSERYNRYIRGSGARVAFANASDGGGDLFVDRGAEGRKVEGARDDADEGERSGLG